MYITQPMENTTNTVIIALVNALFVLRHNVSTRDSKDDIYTQIISMAVRNVCHFRTDITPYVHQKGGMSGVCDWNLRTTLVSVVQVEAVADDARFGENALDVIPSVNAELNWGLRE